MYTVADSVHLRMDSSTPQHTLQDACTMYYVHSGGFSPLENGLFNTTAYNYNMHVLRTMHTVADSVHLRMDSSTPQHTLQDACTMYYAHSGGFSPLENGLFNTTAYNYNMHVLCTVYTVADSGHLRVDSSTPQHTTTTCMYYVLCTQWRIQST